LNQKNIASEIGVHPSTITREFRRNNDKVRGYWERGLNEHTNGLIRQYLPKKSVFIGVSKEEIIMIQNRLNHRPRKVLNYKTSYEVFFSEMGRRLAS